MLENTFCHIPGIGESTESRLWAAGIASWQDALTATNLPLSRGRKGKVIEHLEQSVDALTRRDPAWFAASLPASQHWRMFPHFRDRVAYVDIETTGLSPDYDHITTIVLYDGRDIRYFVRGENLDVFAEAIAGYDLLVTFNGKTFDVPFLRAHFGIPLDHAHIDLRYVMASLGYRGGLKRIERRFGLDRDELADVDGFFAVLLWRDYERSGNRGALDTLLAYNALDVVNLAVLMAHGFNLKTEATPFARSVRIPVPRVPELSELPFQPDPATIRRLRRGP